MTSERHEASELTLLLTQQEEDQTSSATNTPEPAAEVEPVPLPPPLHPGCQLGPYHILRDDGPHPMGQLFAAVHTTLSRSVHLVVLSFEYSQNDETKAEFLSHAAAKAGIHHPGVLAVYEASEVNRTVFFVMERIDAETLEGLQQRRAPLDGSSLYAIATAVAEIALSMEEASIGRTALRPADILLPMDSSPRLNNLATGGHTPPVDEAMEIHQLAGVILGFLKDKTPSLLRMTCERCSPEHPLRLTSWRAFLESLDPEAVRHLHHHTIFAADADRQRANKGRKRLLKAVAGLSLVLGGLWLFLRWMPPESRVPQQALIPAGQYIVSSGKRAKLDAFSIDSSEVTNRHYYYFVEWLRSHPNEANRYDHPDQTPHHSHLPTGWSEVFPGKLTPEKTARDPRWELPVTQVAWWDAFAFASWAGRVLPSEEQWEASGRGTRGFLFPWGDEPDPEQANVARPNFKMAGGEQGAPHPVLQLKDRSPYGVGGLAGNVSEWTGSVRDKKFIVKGSDYASPLVTLDASKTLSPDTRSPQLGFRTTSPPSPSRP